MEKLSDQIKAQVKSSVEMDAGEKARMRLNQIKKKRGGKFKVSEAQFLKELEDMWIAGEFSSAERILRSIESDEEVASRDLIRGEIHIFIMDLFSLLKKRLQLEENLKLEDLIWGQYSTEKVVEAFKEREKLRVI